MSSSRDVVLLLTHSGDYFTVDRVAAALSRSGARPFRLDTDQFPLAVQLTAKISNAGLRYRINYGNCSISTEQVQAVWMRRIWEPKLSKDLAVHFRNACIRESQTMLNNFLDSLRGVRWVDNLQRIREAENKMRQLRVATEVGVRIPRTLITNDPQQVRDFFLELEGKMVTKLLTPISYGMESSPFFFYTSSVKEEDLKEAETLRYSPQVFQEEIPKLRELRVIFVNGNLFVGALDASRYQAKTMDWRRAKPEECPWEPAVLSREFARKIEQLMAKLGLTYGAIDSIEKPDGEYVFLEVNPCGEWGMLERDLDYPISEALAEALLS